MSKPKCALCEKKRAKRACPAKDGALICPPCCAQHRVVDLPCPPDCSYLGAEGSMLLAQRRPVDGPRASRDEILGLMETIGLYGAHPKLNHMFEEAALPVVAEFFKLMEITEEEGLDLGLDDIFHEWLLMGALQPEGSPVIDRLVAGLTRPLEERELASLAALHESGYQLLTLEEKLDEERVRVRDHLAEAVSTLLAPQVAETFEPGETIGGFVTPIEEGPTILLGAIALPRGQEDAVVSRLRDLHQDSPLKDRPLSEFLTRLAPAVPLVIQQQMMAQQGDDNLFQGPPDL